MLVQFLICCNLLLFLHSSWAFFSVFVSIDHVIDRKWEWRERKKNRRSYHVEWNVCECLAESVVYLDEEWKRSRTGNSTQRVCVCMRCSIKAAKVVCCCCRLFCCDMCSLATVCGIEFFSLCSNIACVCAQFTIQLFSAQIWKQHFLCVCVPIPSNMSKIEIRPFQIECST